MFPLEPRGKVPIGRLAPSGFKNATRDVEVIARWWQQVPDANIGIATGEPSKIVVLDVDTHGKDGFASLGSLPELPETMQVETGSGGRHFLFSRTEPMRNSHDKVGPGLDVRADGGYIVAAPSIHPNGKPYQVIHEVDLAPCPEWLSRASKPRRAVVQRSPSARDVRGDAVERARRYLRRIPGAVSGEGGHDATFVAAMKIGPGFDLPPEVALELLTEWNATCKPPWSDRELRHKVEDADRLADERGFLLRANWTEARPSSHERPRDPPPPDDADAPPPDAAESELLTETGMAEALVARCGRDLRHVGEWKKWLTWTGKCWRIDTSGHVQREVKRTIRTLRAEAARSGRKDAQARTEILFKAEKRSVRDNIEALARHEAAVQLEHRKLDASPLLFNVRNGTIDLRTGRLRAHDRADLITKLAPVDYNQTATAPIWSAFLERIFDGKPDVLAFVQRAAGYSLTADVGEQCLFICWGAGANGKSTMLEALKAAMGDNALAAPADLFVASKGESPPDRARHAGRGSLRAMCRNTRRRPPERDPPQAADRRGYRPSSTNARGLLGVLAGREAVVGDQSPAYHPRD